MKKYKLQHKTSGMFRDVCGAISGKQNIWNDDSQCWLSSNGREYTTDELKRYFGESLERLSGKFYLVKTYEETITPNYFQPPGPKQTKW